MNRDIVKYFTTRELLQQCFHLSGEREPPPHWPRNALGSPQRKRVFPGRGNTGNLPWKCDPILDKRMKMDGWMDDGNLLCLCHHHYKIVNICVTHVELLKACLHADITDTPCLVLPLLLLRHSTAHIRCTPHGQGLVQYE